MKKRFLFGAGMVAIIMTLAASLGSAEPADADAHRLAAFVEMLNDLSDRRRRVIYTPYPVSPRLGILHGFVHASDGSAAFARADLVIDAPLPIVVRRAYHSARNDSGDFGNGGWRLSIDERLTPTDRNGLVYLYGNGRQVALSSDGEFNDPVQRLTTDIETVSIEPGGAVEVMTRLGLNKRFVYDGGQYLLARVSDEFDNHLALEHEHGQLQRITASNGNFVAFGRDDRHRIVAVRDHSNRLISYRYDESDRLVSMIDARLEEWRYAYDSHGKLISATTPSGYQDLGFSYAGNGRVAGAYIHGIPSTYLYDGNTTTITDEQSRNFVVTAHSSGLTASVGNPVGTRTSLELSRQGLPKALRRNDRLIARLHYSGSDTTGLQKLRIHRSDAAHYTFLLDRSGRVSKLTGSGEKLIYRVQGYLRGMTPRRIIHGNGVVETIALDQHGNLNKLRTRDGEDWRFEIGASRWIVSRGGAASATLEFDQAGRLIAALTPDGTGMGFDYDDAGLRTKTITSDGIEVAYHYDASGSLFTTEAGHAGGASQRYTYVFGADQRVEGMLGSAGDVHELEYNVHGLATELRSPTLVDLSFDYDTLGRLTSIVPRGQRPIHYRYAKGEADIVAQLDARTLATFNQQREINEFANRFDVRFSRIRPAQFGLIAYDDKTGELGIAMDPERWTPMTHIQRGIAGLRLAPLFEQPQARLDAFAMPSNRFFVPAEFWAVNCCVCCAEPDDDWDYCYEP